MDEQKEAILRGLEAMRESLTSYAEEVWRAVNHHDMDTLAARVQTYQDYQALVESYYMLTGKLIITIQSVAEQPHVSMPRPATLPGVPHTLDENFTFAKPDCYILLGAISEQFNYWTDLYADVCRTLVARDPARAATLPTDPRYRTVYGNWRFATSDAAYLRSRQIGEGLYANANLSANMLRDLMRMLLVDFGLKASDLTIFFQQDDEPHG